MNLEELKEYGRSRGWTIRTWSALTLTARVHTNRSLDSPSTAPPYDSVPDGCDSDTDYSSDFASHADIDYAYRLSEFRYVDVLGRWIGMNSLIARTDNDFAKEVSMSGTGDGSIV